MWDVAVCLTVGQLLLIAVVCLIGGALGVVFLNSKEVE
jgi:hypothetical protein